MSKSPGVVSIGIAAALGPDAAAQLAPVVERAGFHSLWVNDTPGADALEVLAAAAAVTEHLTLATGVIAVDRRPARAILDSVREFALPENRLVIGIGAGAKGPGALARVGEAVRVLSESTPAPILVGALGPKMRRLAAEQAAGSLLSWLTPHVAAEQSAEAHGFEPSARAVIYARTIVDADARVALEEESARYASFPAYAANLARLGISASDTTLPQSGDEGIAPGARAYLDGVDELVLRAITVDQHVDSVIRFIDDAAAELAPDG